MDYFPRIEEENELSRLLWLSRQQNGRLALVTGLPGSGKTETMKKVFSGFRTVTLRIGGKTAGLQMREFISVATSVLGTGKGLWSSSPCALLEKIADLAGEETVIVVIENFDWIEQYWKGEFSAIDSFWRNKGRHTKMFLVLCGISAPGLRKIFNFEDSPMYNILDSVVRFGPVKIREFRDLFAPEGTEANPSDILLCWAMTGAYASPLSRILASGAKDRNSLIEEYFRPGSPYISTKE